MPKSFALAGRSIGMIVIAILVSMAIFQVSGYSAIDAVVGFVEGAITGPGALTSTLRWSLPLVITSLGVVLSFRAGYFNVGAQGQLYLGAIAAAVVSAGLSGPPILVMVVAIAAGALAGSAWALIAAWLKTATGADEVLTTLMLNFIGTLLLQYLTSGPLRDPSGSGQVAAAPPIPQDVRISGAAGVSPSNVIVAVVLAAAIWVLLNRTTFGLSATIVGRNPQAAARQGVSSTRVIWTTFGISGALAGIAGALEVMGPTGRLIQGFSPDVGFTAVLVALVAGLTVLGAVFSGLFFGALASAIGYLPIVTDLPRSALDILQGIVALLITVHLKVAWRRERVAPAADDPAEAPEEEQQHVAVL